VAGDHEGSQLDLRIAVLGDVADDRLKVLAAQAFAGDLAVQRGDRGGRLGLGDRGRYAGLRAKLREGVFGQSQLVTADDGRVVDQVEAGQNAFAVDADFHLGQGLEALGT